MSVGPRQAAKKLEEEGQLRRNVEERAREKRDDTRARDRIRAKLGARTVPPETHGRDRIA